MDALKLVEFSLPPPFRNGILVIGPNGRGECSPLPGRNKESLEEAKIQLEAIASGEKIKNIFPSVAFALESANTPLTEPISVPSTALLMGNKKDIISKAHLAEKMGFTCAKLKINRINFNEAVELAQSLKNSFRLRIDGNRCWTLEEALQFCDHFLPQDFEYIEEPLKNPQLLDQFPFPYALDESVASIKLDGASAVIIKPTVLGSNWRNLAKKRRKKKFRLCLGAHLNQELALVISLIFLLYIKVISSFLASAHIFILKKIF